MTITPAQVSPGLYIGLGILAFLILAIIALSTFIILDGDVPELWLVVAFFVTIVTIIAGFLYPFDMGYHRYYHVTGTVQTVSSRLIADGHGASQRFVVVLDGKPFAVDDTRATTLKEGDQVNLMCMRDYQWVGVSGWVCEWNAETAG